MNLGAPKPGYDPADQAQMRRQLELADRQNHKRDRNLSLGSKVIEINDAVTGELYSISIVNGVITATPL